MTPAHPRARLACPALVCLALGCAGGDASEGGGSLSQGVITSADAGSTGTTDAGPTSSSGGEPDTTDDTGSATGEPATTSDPPPDCGPLDLCGVQCVDLVDDPDNCGKCGISCVIPHATPACAASTCAIGSCDPGWFDCDQDLQTGCEQALTPEEKCAPVCKPGNAETCNLFDDDCNGTCDEGGVAGCRQGVHRSNSPTQGHFYTIDAAEAASGDFTVEFLNFYYLHIEPQPGLVPFYRCLKGDGRRFYTTSATCEGAGPVEGVMGHIGTEAYCGAIGLYRLNGHSEHFYTTSEAERDNAVNNLGYIFEGQVGFVWAGP
jgi:hypothetical protein